MKTWLSAPTKKQVIIICSITAFLFLRVLVTSDFLTNEKFSNRQYLIFGILMALGSALSAAAILLYHAKQTSKGN
jgi:cytochrome bd-type quinol oxidase subunit 1